MTFHFCPICASTVYYQVAGYDVASLAIPVGAFADSAFPPPVFSVYEARMHAWVRMPEGVEHLG